ncbi:MAG: PEP-CTERM-box response regulator transcription factor [Kiritimatiellae bacterium]|nr:PEP-CTERM-box response regulator transcription factor [Kiritimatiellia bacterium]
MKPTLLIVDDDEGIQTQMKWALADDYEVVLAQDRESARKAMGEAHPDVALLDLGLPPRPNDTEEGFKALGELLAERPAAKIIVITGQGEKENALKAIGEGAYDFLGKPIEIDELKVILKRAFHVSQLEQEYRKAQAQLAGGDFEGMIGTSPSMQDVFTSVRKLATTDVPVLILGESGTGKEMVALGIHRRSARADGPFVAINCGAIPENLLESELFGHEKGAFTGAHAQNVGRIETARGGTLFLDEIGELPSALQVKMLRFLQEGTIERVGGRKTIEVDARVVAATNSDLKQGMSEGSFREDLYFRLAVVVISLPPLRDRHGDIPLLAKALLKRHAGEEGSKLKGFSAAALRALDAYEWPGNVREMENLIRRAVIMAEGSRVGVADLNLGTSEVGYPGATLKEAREMLESDLITRALGRHKGNISRAASDLGVSRPTLYDLMDKLGMREESSKVGAGES